MYRKNFILISTVVLSGFISTAGADIARIIDDPPPADPTKWAVIVGVGEYLDEGISDLPNAVNDASALRNALVQLGAFKEENVLLLTSTQESKYHPTRANLMKFLNSFLQLAGPDDTILFYFAGHGMTKDDKLYLLPYDASIFQLTDTGFPFSYLEDVIQNSVARKRIIILDACHSGAGRSVEPMSSAAILELDRASYGTAVLASCGENELSYEMPGTGHGAFTYYLIESLYGKADENGDQNISVAEAVNYTERNTALWAGREGFSQRPWRRLEGSGQFFLSSVPKNADSQDFLKSQVERLDSKAPLFKETIGEQQFGDTTTFLGMEFVWVPAGSFTMGAPKDSIGSGADELAHDVTISKGFWIGKTEVTQEFFEKIIEGDPSRSALSNDSYFIDSSRPVDSISWADAQRFIKLLNGRGEGRFRLPTEAEWEYACRGGQPTYDLSQDLTNLAKTAWHSNADQTKSVKSRQPNTLGVYDMQGNVWEWCSDWYGGYQDSSSSYDPTGPEEGLHRVLRGGSWGDTPEECRKTYRNSAPENYSNYHVGFRLVRE